MKNGFYAQSRETEKRCTGLEINQLMEVEDVTSYIHGATQGLSGEAFGKAQRAEMSRIEAVQRSHRHALRRRQPVPRRQVPPVQVQALLRRAAGVRARVGAASFGGDPDNFNYPRYALDVTYLRAYGANGQPVAPERYLAYNPQGAQRGDLVMAVGHPGSTQRLLTVAQLAFLRDVVLPKAPVHGRATRSPDRVRSPRHRAEAPGRRDAAVPGEQLQGQLRPAADAARSELHERQDVGRDRDAGSPGA